MPTDKLEVGNLFIVDLDTGERTELNGIEEVTFTTEDTSVSNENKAYITPRELSLSLDISDISIEMMEMLMPKFRILGLMYSQNKTHRKKRINKKWAKKYGYTCTVYYVEGESSMAGLVQSLKKGNQTLAKKVEDLEGKNGQLREENRNLKLENYNLKNKLNQIEKRKISKEDEMFKFFTGIYSRVLDAVDIEKIKE